MKGLAIAGVVTGHLGFEEVDMFVNYWHLPVFYFVSGYFLKKKSFEDVMSITHTLVKKSKKLLFPFLSFAIILIFIHNILSDYGVIGSGAYGMQDYVDAIKNLFWLSSNEELMGAMWFLPSLFIVTAESLLAFILLKRIGVNYYVGWGGVILLLSGIYAIRAGLPSPWCVWQNCIMASIFCMGVLVAEHGWMSMVRSHIIGILSFVILITFVLLQIKAGCQPSSLNNFEFYWMIAYLAGIAMISYISSRIYDKKWAITVALVGDYSFSIMALHFVAFKMVTVVIDPENLADFPTSKDIVLVWWPVYLIAGLVIPVLCSMTKIRITRYLFSMKEVKG